MPNSRPAPLLGSVAFLSLGGVVPVLLYSYGAPRDGLTEALLTAIIILAGARFAWVLAARERHLHEMVLWLFVYLFLGVAPMIQFRSRFPGTTPFISLEFAPLAAAVVLVGCLALLLGSALAGRRTDPIPNERELESSPVDARRTYLWAWIALGLGAVFVLRIGPASLFAARRDFRSAQADGLGTDPAAALLAAGARIGLIVAFVALMNLRAQKKAAERIPPVLLPLVVFAALFVLVNPLSSARYTFGTAILAAVGALGAYATLRRFRVVAVTALAGMVVIFPLLDTFRRSLDNVVTIESPLDSMTTGDFDAFAQIINAVEYTFYMGYAWGYQMLGVVFFWVPRSVWETKPTDTGAAIAEFKGYRFENLSAPLWAELYINLGWVGLIAGMIGVGFLLRRLDRKAEMALRFSSLPGVLTCITPFYLLILLRGSLLQAALNLAVIVAASWFVSARPRRSNHQQSAPRGRRTRSALLRASDRGHPPLTSR